MSKRLQKKSRLMEMKSNPRLGFDASTFLFLSVQKDQSVSRSNDGEQYRVYFKPKFQ